jgi:hypothetical protein
MHRGQIVYLGLGLLFGAGLVFIISWNKISRMTPGERVGLDRIERLWFRCLAACFCAGLAILMIGALGSVVQHVIGGLR